MLKRFSVLFSLLIACTLSVQAFNFQPISQDYSPSGKGANHIFRVANTDDEKIAVKISIRSRTIDPDGTEIQEEADDQFMIYPRQLILNPNEGRSIRIKWNGDPNPEKELSYRVIAEQVPVSFSEVQPIEGGQITLIYRYEGTIYIVPPGAKPKISIKSVKRDMETETVTETVFETVTEMQGEEEVEVQVEKEVETIIEHEFLLIEIENTGTRHGILDDITVKLARNEDDTDPIILKEKDLKGVAGENILAGSVRYFKLPLPEDLWEGPVYGSIE